MKYTAPSFTVPASAGSAAYCAEHGHTMPDVRGKCVRCGHRVRFADYALNTENTTTTEPDQIGDKTSR